MPVRYHSRRRLLGAFAGMFASSRALTGCSAAGVSQPNLTKFIDSIEGEVLLPVAAGYERLRRVQSHNPRTDKRPALIARCANPSDVALSVLFARENAMEIAVRGGGHDVMGQCTTDGGVLIDLGPLQDVQMGDANRSVRVGAGVIAGQLNPLLQNRGVAVPLGCHPGVGVAGLTLGGGLGWLLGKYGATCDSVTAFDVVTAQGQRVRATADDEADLFWALRGGGGNFGVVTAIEYRTYPMDTIVRGFVVYSASRLREFMQFYDQFMQAAPDELTVEVVIATAQEPLITITFCYAGDERQAAKAIEPLLRFGPPLADDVAVVPYARLGDVPAHLIRRFFGDAGENETAPQPQGEAFNYWQGASLSDWSEPAIQALSDAFSVAAVGYSIGIGHYIHGQISRVADADTAIVRREGSYSYFFNVNWRGVGDARSSMRWVDRSLSSLSAYADPTYVNYLSSNDHTAIAQTYGRNYDRLRRIKNTFDPFNVFHLNRNIVPL